ncbi:MAG: methyltransferase domain-containing protein [Nostoc sp.]
MIGADFEYIKKLLNAGLIFSPCLDLGAGGGGEGNNCKNLLQNAGLKYIGTDMYPGEGVDIVANFEDSEFEINKVFVNKFSSILVLNVLEHTFDPIKVLDNVFSILEPNGTCVIITPTVWPIHDYPIDCWRINPTFYEEYSKRRSVYLLEEYFEYVGFYNVQTNINRIAHTYVLPKPKKNKFELMYSKTIHKLFNTYGRSMSCASHIAVGAVIKNTIK